METHIEATPVPHGGIGDRVDGSFLTGANLRQRDLRSRGFFLELRCSNLLDTNYRYPNTLNSLLITRDLIAEGRSVLVTLGWDF